jgi:hypothetical protein
MVAIMRGRDQKGSWGGWDIAGTAASIMGGQPLFCTVGWCVLWRIGTRGTHPRGSLWASPDWWPLPAASACARSMVLMSPPGPKRLTETLMMILCIRQRALRGRPVDLSRSGDWLAGAGATSQRQLTSRPPDLGARRGMTVLRSTMRVRRSSSRNPCSGAYAIFLRFARNHGPRHSRPDRQGTARARLWGGGILDCQATPAAGIHGRDEPALAITEYRSAHARLSPRLPGIGAL